MASVSSQRDLMSSLKKEIVLNVGMLSKSIPPSSELSRIMKDSYLEKPTQNVFIHLSQYLVSIIDPQVSLTWPLYDTKSERTYRNEISIFISDYSSKGLFAPVLSSYLVNPGCYKVVLLMFQMSQLAVQCVLLKKMDKDCQKNLYSKMTEEYKSNKDDSFVENIEQVTEMNLTKYSNYMQKREALEKIAQKLRDQIIKIEEKLKKNNPQGLIDNLVDGYVKKYPLDENTKKDILKIKNVNLQPEFLNKWLENIDKELDLMESNWDLKVTPLLEVAQKTARNTETLISRQTGGADKKTFTIEFNPDTDDISTDDLQKQVNTEQKYVLKNIVKDGKLQFPNLIRGFLISICFILKNVELSDEIFRFNEYLRGGARNYSEVVSAMRVLMDRVMNAEGKLQTPQRHFNNFNSLQDLPEIPPIPDLSDLKMKQEFHSQVLFDPLTPFNLNKHQFNLLKQKTRLMKPLPKSLLMTPFHMAKENFFPPIITCNFDNSNVTNNNANYSIISNITKLNETVAECASGFTKQQLNRLLSTSKKSSSSKKFKHKMARQNMKIKRGGLFPENNSSNESIAIFRSQSSPNLYETRERRYFGSVRSRQLSIMKEDSPSLSEMSGIAAIERESSHSTPHDIIGLESNRKLLDASSLPSMSNLTPRSDISNDTETDLNQEIDINDFKEFKQPMLPLRKSREIDDFIQPQRKSIKNNDEKKPETPKNNPPLIKKTSSLEKIIHRFKKFRASVLPPEPVENNEFKTIYEEKENLNVVNVDVFTANRNLLPDLLSPSCNASVQLTNDVLDQFCLDSDEDKPRSRPPRESLGTALGVDHTFLDQFDLID